jgi:molybdopterin-guanine dinucleotide biosynthesis protein A
MIVNSMTESLAVAILAGGRSTRMKKDKAFLRFQGQTFLELIYNEMSRISQRVLVLVGNKDTKKFKNVLGPNASIINDSFPIGTPVGGMLTASSALSEDYVGFIACDLPFVRSELILKLYHIAKGHSAAIPRWENGGLEPLCAVYRREEVEHAANAALHRGMVSCKDVISLLNDVVYVDVEDARSVDPELRSFLNINSRRELSNLMAGLRDK